MADPTISPPMERALALARGVLGTVAPNPAVGAVVVREGRIVGEGATRPPGGDHAEVAALRAAGNRARGATLYVTLEPCAHFGRTPPCVDAVIEAGIGEVVIAVADPDPQVDGRGIDRLREAGIGVRIGDGAAAGAAHYEPYLHQRRTGRPFVAAKFAASLDGRIASVSGDSRWISGPQTRAWAHRMRPLLDAILVGVETIVVDNPQLTARPDDWRGPVPQPLRVVLDSRGRTPIEARVLDDQELASTLIATTEASPQSWRDAVAQRGAATVVLPSDDGRVSLPDLLDHLGGPAGVVHLLVEGGGEVLGAFFDQRLIDKVYAVVAPMLIGGDAQTAVRGRGAQRMADALRLSHTEIERLGDDILLTGYPSAPEAESGLRLRPAGVSDAAEIDALLTASGLSAAAADWLAQARRSEAVVWLAAGDDDRAQGVAALQSPPGSETAHLAGLALRRGAPTTLSDRLREAAEASAQGRGRGWITIAARSGGPDPGHLRGVGYRYFRRTVDGGDLYIKALDPLPSD